MHRIGSIDPWLHAPDHQQRGFFKNMSIQFVKTMMSCVKIEFICTILAKILHSSIALVEMYNVWSHSDEHV